jgi:hypothetical protein
MADLVCSRCFQLSPGSECIFRPEEGIVCRWCAFPRQARPSKEEMDALADTLWPEKKNRSSASDGGRDE